MPPAPDRPAVTGSLRLVLAADPPSVRAALAQVLRCSPVSALTADHRATVELVLAEVLNNVAEHAYGGGGGPVSLRLRLSPRGIACRVADRGTGLPKGRLPDPAAQFPDPANLPQGGFGWPLIRLLTRGLRYRRLAGCNVLVFTVPRNS